MPPVVNKKKAAPPPGIDACLFGEEDEEISLSNLRKIASQGICDQGSHRSVAWRVLLGFLPCSKQTWPAVLQEKRALYQELVQKVFSSPIDDGVQLMGHHGKQAALHQQELEKEAIRQQAEDDIDDVVLGVKHVGIKTNIDVEGVKQNRGDITTNTTTESEKDATDSNHNDATKEQDAFVENDAIVKQNENDENSGDTPAPLVTNTETPTEITNVPSHIREQWKKSGRDTSVLVEMSNATGHNVYGVNTLLVVDNHGEPILSDEMTNEDANDDKWVHFLDNASLLDEIRKDVVRTHPDLKFFLEPGDNLGHRRYAAIERILFVWAKLNKGVRYVQGMNEIVGTLYFVLANDFNEEWACHAEADTYFLFNTLMAEMSDIFVPAMDNHDTGIQGRISNMNALLSLHDPEVASHLEEVGIHASFYAIRWLTTLLSREFLLPDTIRLWDSMFASTHKDNFLRYVCVTMVMVIRDDLLKGDFSSCLRLLQSYPPTNLDSLLESSRALWIYESQITLACHKGGISLSQALCTISPPPSVVMAYGLVGGVAIRRIVRDPSSTTGTNGGRAAANGGGGESNDSNQQGRAFFTGAKDYLSGLGREAAKTYQSRRAGGGGGGGGATNNDVARGNADS